MSFGAGEERTMICTYEFRREISPSKEFLTDAVQG